MATTVLSPPEQDYCIIDDDVTVGFVRDQGYAIVPPETMAPLPPRNSTASQDMPEKNIARLEAVTQTSSTSGVYTSQQSLANDTRRSRNSGPSSSRARSQSPSHSGSHKYDRSTREGDGAGSVGVPSSSWDPVTPPRRAPEPSNPTPHRQTASSLEEDAPKAEVEKWLISELAHRRVYANDLVERLIGEWYPVEKAKEALQHLMDRKDIRKADAVVHFKDQELVELAGNAASKCRSALQCSADLKEIFRWPKILKSRHSRFTEKRLVEAFNSLAETTLQHVLHNENPLNRLNRWAASPDPHRPFPLGSRDSDNRPDLVLLPPEAFSGDTARLDKAYVNFPNGLVFGEVKETTLGSGKWQALRYMRMGKMVQPWRRTMFGIIFVGYELSILRADSSGVEECSFDIRTARGALDFIRILGGFALMQEHEFGFNPRFKLQYVLRDSYRVRSVLSIRLGTIDFTVGEELFKQVSITGRGTRVVEVTPQGELDDDVRALQSHENELNNLALKMLWLSGKRELHQSSNEHHMNTLVRNKMLKQKSIAPKTHVVPVLMTWKAKLNGMYDSTLNIREWVESYPLKSHIMENRTLTYMLMEKYRKLGDAQSWQELAIGIFGAIRGHQWLFEELGILHRDVSDGNIVLDLDSMHPRGLIIDVGLARQRGPEEWSEAMNKATSVMWWQQTPMSEKRPEGEPVLIAPFPHGDHRAEITGTPLYIAADLLDSSAPCHLPFHDVESFFYVLFLMPLMYTPPSLGWDGIVTEYDLPDSLSRWKTLEHEVNSGLKTKTLYHPSIRKWEEILEYNLQIRRYWGERAHRAPYMNLVAAFAEVLRKFQFGGNSDEFRHKDIFAIFTTWIDGQKEALGTVGDIVFSEHWEKFLWSQP